MGSAWILSLHLHHQCNKPELKAQYNGSDVHCYALGTLKPSALKQNTLITSCLSCLDGDKEKTVDSCCIAFLDLPHVASLHASL